MVKQLLVAGVSRLQRLLAQSGRSVRYFFDCSRQPGRMREARGLSLLRDWLSAEQLAQYDAKGYFDVTGCTSGKRYRIRHGTGLNIFEMEQTGRPRTGWCFVPRANLVAGDVMLAQKIALETDEQAALAIAKKFSLK